MDSFVLTGCIGVLVLVALFFTRMAVGYALAVVGFVGYAYLTSLQSALTLLSRDIFSVFSSYELALVPLFVFMGYVAYYAGVSKRLYDMAYKWTCGIRGGLAMATIGACTAFGAVCGSTTATAATIGAIALPEMQRYKYAHRLSAGSVAAGAGLGALMPPSVILIIYGILTQISIGKLFLAGIVPALFIAVLFMLAIWVFCALDPGQAGRGECFPWSEMLRSLGEIWETVLVFVLVMGGMFFGFFTPTKAGAVGSCLLLAIVAVQGKMSRSNFAKAVNDTLNVSCMVIILVTGATIFGHFLALSRVSMELANLVAELAWPPWAIMAAICAIYLLAGCFIDALALITLTIPIFFPIVLNLGYDPIWFGVLIVLITQMGIITPPVGVNAYIVKGIAPYISLQDIFIGILPFLLALIAGTAVLIAFPQVVTFLPHMVR
ncbi:TRAP transporter large permease [Desulfovermiculus halophilus]|uniref:TRAP transporter large permease n=1 Tax=Desulfovermiculus halophilus TaxID=339722 RepID=UPI0004847172|nr:TRAP transporter large permease [Desulfovermiculus halophilus]